MKWHAGRRAARIFFYIGIAFAVLIVLHIIIVLVYRRLGMPGPPQVLEFPRLELWLALALLQPFGQGCGRALFCPARRLRACQTVTCTFGTPALAYAKLLFIHPSAAQCAIKW